MLQTEYRHLKARTEQGVLILRVLDAHIQTDAQVDTLGRELADAVDRPDVRKVVLDLQNLQGLSSAGLRPLLSLRRRLRERGGRLVLCNLSPVVSKIFYGTRLVSSRATSAVAFEVLPDVAAAVAELSRAAEE